MRSPVVVIGAGVGGLSAALDLATRGVPVLVLEKEATPGGKMRQVFPAGRPIDAGPTVFTLRRVFDELFAAAGADLDAELRPTKLNILARHAWDGAGTGNDNRLDLLPTAKNRPTRSGVSPARRIRGLPALHGRGGAHFRHAA